MTSTVTPAMQMGIGTADDVDIDAPAKRARKGMDEVINASLPSRESDRRGAMFRFVRSLKSVPRYRRIPDPQQVEPLFRDWYAKALPFITRTDYAKNWADFRYMLTTVKHPANHVRLECVVKLADATPLPSPSPGVESLWRRRLLAVCRLLQVQHGNRAFFLASRPIAELLGVTQVSVSRALREFLQKGVLRLVERGRFGKHRASYYRYTGDRRSVAEEAVA